MIVKGFDKYAVGNYAVRRVAELFHGPPCRIGKLPQMFSTGEARRPFGVGVYPHCVAVSSTIYYQMQEGTIARALRQAAGYWERLPAAPVDAGEIAIFF